MKEVKKCSLVQFDRHGNVPKNNHEINKLALHLSLNNHKEIHLVFFHADAKNFIIGEEFRIAKKIYYFFGQHVLLLGNNGVKKLLFYNLLHDYISQNLIKK